jgi:hypothetical protein
MNPPVFWPVKKIIYDRTGYFSVEFENFLWSLLQSIEFQHNFHRVLETVPQTWREKLHCVAIYIVSGFYRVRPPACNDIFVREIILINRLTPNDL